MLSKSGSAHRIYFLIRAISARTSGVKVAAFSAMLAGNLSNGYNWRIAMANASIIKSVLTARGYFAQTIKDLSESQLTEVPDGASNSVLWNIGHIVHSNSSMVYGPCGLDSPIPSNYEELFKGGTSPGTWSTPPSTEEVLGHFKTMNKDIVAKYTAGELGNFATLELMPGMTLDNIEDALGFCCVHEGVHIGAVIALKKRLG